MVFIFKRKDGTVFNEWDAHGSTPAQVITKHCVSYRRHSVADNRAIYVEENSPEPQKLAELNSSNWPANIPAEPPFGQPSLAAFGSRTFLVGVVAGAFLSRPDLTRTDPRDNAKRIISQADAILDQMQWPNGKPGEDQGVDEVDD